MKKILRAWILKLMKKLIHAKNRAQEKAMNNAKFFAGCNGGQCGCE
jgi:hypothetical protein